MARKESKEEFHSFICKLEKLAQEELGQVWKSISVSISFDGDGNEKSFKIDKKDLPLLTEAGNVPGNAGTQAKEEQNPTETKLSPGYQKTLDSELKALSTLLKASTVVDPQTNGTSSVTTKKKSYKCPTCSKAFIAQRFVMEHQRRMHGVKKECTSEPKRPFGHPPKTKELPFKCYYCNGSFSSRPKLELHLYKHTGVKPFMCQFCDKAYLHMSSLEKHRQQVHLD